MIRILKFNSYTITRGKSTLVNCRYYLAKSRKRYKEISLMYRPGKESEKWKKNFIEFCLKIRGKGTSSTIGNWQNENFTCVVKTTLFLYCHCSNSLDSSIFVKSRQYLQSNMNFTHLKDSLPIFLFFIIIFIYHVSVENTV